MSQQSELASQFKDQLLKLPNGDFLCEIIDTAYKIGYADGYENAKQTYGSLIETYKKLVELLKKVDECENEKV